MDNNIQPDNKDEIELGTVFIYFEKFFKKLFELISQLFKGLYFLIGKATVFIFLVLNIFKKHYFKIIGFGVLIFGLFFFLDKISDPIYQSNLIIEQNYNTGKLLYNNISRYNSLARNRDSIGLSVQLNIPQSKASKLIGFDVLDNKNRNDLLKEYYGFIKEVDSTLLISFTDFMDQYDKEKTPIQTIKVESLDPQAFNGLTEAIVSSLESNKFFKEEKRKFEKTINEKIEANKSSLDKSDELQKQYLELLRDYYGAAKTDNNDQTTLNLNLSNNRDKTDTKEFQLFEEQNKIKFSITELQKELEDKKVIIGVLNDFSAPIQLRSFYSEYKIWAALITSLLVLVVYIFKEIDLFSLINKFGTKDKLLEK